MYLVVAIVMLMGVYMSYSMLITPHLNDINTFRGGQACMCLKYMPLSPGTIFLDSRSIYNTGEQNDSNVLNDIPIPKVCRELYDIT